MSYASKNSPWRAGILIRMFLDGDTAVTGMNSRGDENANER
jgi:hypothetical protein